MIDFSQIIPALGAGGVLTWAGNAALQWLQARDERKDANAAATLDLEQHRDGLALQMLTVARTEITALTEQVARLRPMESALYDLAQAMDHIDALLSATSDDRARVERNARAFLNRMRRLTEAQGTLANEVQRAASAAALGKDPTKAG